MFQIIKQIKTLVKDNISEIFELRFSLSQVKT